jgi:tRNA1(Val) A37 N6-methylase TrmN6
LYIFDALLVFVTMLLLNVVHPAEITRCLDLIPGDGDVPLYAHRRYTAV